MIHLSKHFLQNSLSKVKRIYSLDSEDRITFDNQVWNGVRLTDQGFHFLVIENNFKIVDESRFIPIVREHKRTFTFSLDN